jgi:hypothetical protein
MSESGDEMILKNNAETEIVLRRIVQLSTSTPVAIPVPTNAYSQ